MARIVIEPVTRIEGHAKISIDLDEAGAVERARFHVTEFRGFEKLCVGRPFQEMPALMARVCGICPVSHMLASAKAGDRLLGVEVPRAAVLQRRLGNYAQLLQSHALSFFHLSSPDLLLGFDADPRVRNLFGLIEAEPELARRGIRLRMLGQRVIELLGDKRVHPGSWAAPGGVNRVFHRAAGEEIRAMLPEAFASMRSALDTFEAVLDRYPREIAAMGALPTLSLGLVSDDGGLEYDDGKIRVVDAAGNVVADRLEPWRYHTFLHEASEDWSYVKFPFYAPLGYPAGMYRVGPLARINVASHAGTPEADRALRALKDRGSNGVVGEAFFYHQARLVEMLHALERIAELLEEPELYGEEIRARAFLNHRRAVGFAEAPRGILFHHYEVDEHGLVQAANLLIATGQNNLAMNQAVEQTAKAFITSSTPDEGILNRVEAAIRCFDPCLSCSTHALGQMPLVVELRGPSGELVRRATRGG